jgi:hypothetical protein
MVGVAQLVRVPGCGPGGRGFEPLHSPHFGICNYAPVAQLDRVADFESVGRRFESYRAYQNIKRGKGPLAQLAEQMTLNH